MFKKKIVVIGGGTGTYTVLSGLKRYSNKLDISVIVSMMDDGGSNRIIRDEFGLLPTSDIRQCIVALSMRNSEDLLRKLFTYRYENGIGISGMTFGNLFMAALTDIVGSQKEAIDETCKLLDCVGNIIPVTFDKTHLVARYSNGKQVLGEHFIDEPSLKQGKYRIVDLEIIPDAEINKDAVKAVEEADLIILGPGDLYTSVLANVVVDDLSKRICKSKGKKVYVANLMSKYGQTNNFKLSDLIYEVEKYIECKLDYVLVNDNKKAISKNIVKKYYEEKANVIEDDLLEKDDKRIIRADLISNRIYKKSKSDKLVRSLIRHDSDKLAKALIKLLAV